MGRGPGNRAGREREADRVGSSAEPVGTLGIAATPANDVKAFGVERFQDVQRYHFVDLRHPAPVIIHADLPAEYLLHDA